MLDVVTKRRIDTARDILVGKLPDPKSQVEQITIALIYKFMDDMDRESLELGGRAKFFTGEYSKYAWSKIFDLKLSGYETVNVYGEAIQRMNQNPNIPQLFRDIFKNAYLPYRDPETLKSFLKVINDFEYDHSERLGDAFEYLLSVLGSQGEAGQFRTPRHIIDFMVAIVDPKKNETVLDPACGTAGFLISSYKHILKHNSENFDPEKDPKAFELHGVKLEEITINSKKYAGDKLTSDDKERLVRNVVGYDISPDMVRLSLVNMYLHGFSNPRIFEYDTLTSEERWNEYADVIMANPPFMSPKGGIRPHKRFSIESSRSEVLFVDYIAEHLNPQGRAAVIVPEGIIFQTQTTHKNLRKMLIEKNYLVGVISLPAGVFNPYSGVKTCILWMDSMLAKKTDKIFFVKVENDGFDLGAQRRPIKQNDLPGAFYAIMAYRNSLTDGKEFDAEKWRNVLIVERSRIAENSDFNLTGDRYKVPQTLTKQKWPMVKLSDRKYFMVESGGTPDSENMKYWHGEINWATLSDLPQEDFVTSIYSTERKITEVGLKDSSAKILPIGSILVSSRATIGRVAVAKVPVATNQGFKNIVIQDHSKVLSEFVALMMTNLKDAMELMTAGSTFKEISKSNFEQLQIPLPPLEAQEQIVAEIEGYQKIVNAVRQIVESYKPHIDINPSWKATRVQDICERESDLVGPKKFEGIGNYVGLENIESHTGNLTGIVKTDLASIKSTKVRFEVDDILYGRLRPNLNKVWLADRVGVCSTDIFVLSVKKNLAEPFYVAMQLRDEAFNQKVLNGLGGAQLPRVSFDYFSNLEIPLPDLEVQREIIKETKKIQGLINANKQLIEIFEQKIKDRIAQVWGEK